jgi:hypothetical protein
MTPSLTSIGSGDGPYRPKPGDDVVEVPLLLQGWQMSALEKAAHSRGLTAGEMVRDLLRDFLARLPDEAAGRPQGRC